ncbi:Transcription initiation factor TFIID subunit 9B [Geranomyces michiganensis]|nr:Transcription initiation factor TFIID subunit 9B [Geranomyces michiganensis]
MTVPMDSSSSTPAAAGVSSAAASGGNSSNHPPDSVPSTPRPAHSAYPPTVSSYTPSSSHPHGTSSHQDGINPETAALLTAAAAHGRQDAVQLPRDAKLVSLLLQSMGVQDYEPRVVPQLLEFMHRYVLDVLGDAQTYAEHANHHAISLDDVRIAIEGRAAHSFTNPPRREFLEAVAVKKNSVPLPLIPEKFGVRLPPERHTLTSTNFQIAVKRSHPAPQTGRPHSHQPANSAAPSYPASPSLSARHPPMSTFRSAGGAGRGSGTVPEPSMYSQPPPMLPPMPSASATKNRDDDYDEEEEDGGGDSMQI